MAIPCLDVGLGMWHPSSVRRGEIWQYRPVLERPGQSLLRLIVSADGLAAPEEMEQVSNALRAAQDL